MKATINGRRFDTAKAILIGAAGTPRYSKSNSWAARLYKTPRVGSYFLAGSGGMMTRFNAAPSGIIPLTVGEAEDWAHEFLKPKQIKLMESV